ncbi:MAG: hypothetical protein RLZZ56_501 [Actinomycetota bacterium]|jgi:hypothetical protein
MIDIENTISESGKSILHSLVGEELLFIGGPEVPDFLVSDFFVIGSSGLNISISAAMANLSVDSVPEDFSKFEIEVSSEETVASTKASGNMYLLNRRGLIASISLVKETLSNIDKGVEKWSCKTDVAIVIKLQTGFVVLRLVSHSVETIVVEYVRDFSLDSFEKPSSRFENDLFETYVSTFELEAVH